MSLIQTPFGFASTAAQVAAGADLTGRRVIVTGASSGIGIETVRALAGTGADITLAVRDVGAGERAAQDVALTSDNTKLHVAPLDLANPASIGAFVASWDGDGSGTSVASRVCGIDQYAKQENTITSLAPAAPLAVNVEVVVVCPA